MEQETRAIYDILKGFRSAADASPDPIVLYDTLGRAAYVNPGFEQTFGWAAEEVLGRRIDFVPSEAAEETANAIRRMVDGEKVRNFQTRRRRKDGQVLDVELSASQILSPKGQAFAYIVILRDITERKRMEARLRQDQRPHDAGIAQEMNAPLQALASNLQFLRGRVGELRKAVAGASAKKELGELLDEIPARLDDAGHALDRIRSILVSTG